MDNSICQNCQSTDLRYDTDLFRNVCERCNTMQEVTGIAVTTLDFDGNVNFQRLRKINLPGEKKLSKKAKNLLKLAECKPWKMIDLFKWLFEKQVESLKPYMKDPNSFDQVCRSNWDRYARATGENFDLTKALIDDIKLQKYPLGWGPEYDPREGQNTVNRATAEFSSQMRDQQRAKRARIKPIDKEKIDRNKQKVRIERLVSVARRQSARLQENRIKTSNSQADIDDEEEKHNSSDSSNESALSDEDDPKYVQIDHIDDIDINRVRCLRKKRPHEVVWRGTYMLQANRYMENNVFLLLLSVYFSQFKEADIETEENADKQKCTCLMDILHLIRTHKVPYIRVTGFIPTDQFQLNDRTLRNAVLRDSVPEWEHIVKCSYKLLRDLRFSHMILTDIDSLILRMLSHLNLPMGLSNFIGILRHKTRSIYMPRPKKMEGSKWLFRTNYKSLKTYPVTLFPEPLCVAYIFFALRAVFKLDGKYETKLGNLVRELERLESVPPGRMFVWADWWRQMYRGPTLASSRCMSNSWADLKHIISAQTFLEGEVDLPFESQEHYERYSHLGMYWNADYNHRGRLINEYNPSQEVLDALMKPIRMLKKCLETGSNNASFTPNVVEEKYFGDADVEFLLNPSGDPPAWTQTVDESGRPVAEEICALVRQHSLSIERRDVLQSDISADIYHRNINTEFSNLEINLLHILTRDTGFQPIHVLNHYCFLETMIFPSSTDTRKPFHRKRKRSD